MTTCSKYSDFNYAVISWQYQCLIYRLRDPGEVGGYNEGRIVDLFLPGVQALSNYHTLFANAIKGGLNHSESDRNTDYSAGSYTSYHDYTMISQTEIHPGSEIFSDGPEEWRNEFNMPSMEDLKQTEEMINKLHEYHMQNEDITEEQWIDILYRMREEMITKQGVASLFPRTLEELLEMKSSGAGKRNLKPRSFDWIKKNGKFARRKGLIYCKILT